MSRFTTQLETVLQKLKLTRAALAERAGIPYPSLTNYAIGRTAPDKSAMAAICSGLPDQDAANLLMARLADECPDEYERLIRIEPRVFTLDELSSDYLPALPTNLKEALAKIARAAAYTDEWSDLILDLARIANVRSSREQLAAAEDAGPYNPDTDPVAQALREEIAKKDAVEKAAKRVNS